MPPTEKTASLTTAPPVPYKYRSVECGFLRPIADVPQRRHFTSLITGIKALTLNYIGLL